MGKHTRVPKKYKELASVNPWGLTPMQCYVMALACEFGGAKPVFAETDIPFRSVQDHIQAARARMGLRSHDVRVYINFDRWITEYAANTGFKPDKTHKRSPSRRPQKPQVDTSRAGDAPTGSEAVAYQPGTRLRGAWPVFTKPRMDPLVPVADLSVAE